jgi:hypothetical protein
MKEAGRWQILLSPCHITGLGQKNNRPSKIKNRGFVGGSVVTPVPSLVIVLRMASSYSNWVYVLKTKPADHISPPSDQSKTKWNLNGIFKVIQVIFNRELKLCLDLRKEYNLWSLLGLMWILAPLLPTLLLLLLGMNFQSPCSITILIERPSQSSTTNRGNFATHRLYTFVLKCPITWVQWNKSLCYIQRKDQATVRML